MSNYEAGSQMELTANTNWRRRTPYITTIIAGHADPDTALSSMNVRGWWTLCTPPHSTANSYKQQGVTNVHGLRHRNKANALLPTCAAL